MRLVGARLLSQEEAYRALIDEHATLQRDVSALLDALEGLVRADAAFFDVVDVESARRAYRDYDDAKETAVALLRKHGRLA